MRNNQQPETSSVARCFVKATSWATCALLLNAALLSFGLFEAENTALALAISFGASFLCFICHEQVWSSVAQRNRWSNGGRMSLAPCVIWFTGLPSSGKTTLSLKLKEYFNSLGAKVEHLDGDSVRAAVSGTGFSRTERNDHIRRMGFFASRFEQQGIPVIASFVSPYRESREFARQKCAHFIEIYLSTDLAECSKRDVKGLYREAKLGKRPGMTGVDDPYEPPTAAELVLDTGARSQEQCLQSIVQILLSRGLLRTQESIQPNFIEEHGSSIAA